ncbi:O-antigen ligase family protein [Solwaraspora sp. WMMD1047]|uniref:O-antigen ligase family protein n=1 Tax=Solwaraspora sp. WMMD1047 TaxID=3016102 RepID=UPI002417048A|nr:O-antigen ligase family protein [Solwaraspora sp. WMMD1047]MDG4831444.1 O-antigen ligase family protein [Solwaraspora sp. WMMD1047]
MITVAVCAGAIAAMIAARFRTAATLTLFAVLASPIFIEASSGLPTISRLITPPGAVGPEERGIHLGIILILPLATFALLDRAWRPRACQPYGSRLIGWLFFLYTAGIVIGVALGGGLNAIVFYIQTITPLLAWYAVTTRQVNIRKVCRVVIVATLGCLLLVHATVIYHSGATLLGNESVERVLTAGIPQYRNYFPFIMVCGLALAVGCFRAHRRSSIALITATVLALPLLWSRTGLAMLFLAAAVAYFAQPRQVSIPLRLAIGTIGGLAGLALLVPLVSRGMIGERGEESAKLSAENRVDIFRNGFDRLVHSPIFGDSFRPLDLGPDAGELSNMVLFRAHNQYLDIALRGGVPAALLAITLLILFSVRAWRIARQSPDRDMAGFHAALLGITAAICVGNFAHLFMVQPWTGGLFFALLGISSLCPTPPSGRHGSSPGIIPPAGTDTTRPMTALSTSRQTRGAFA